MTIAGMAAVKTVSAEASLFERNVEALAGGEGVIGIGRICAYDKWTWCVYLYPYECYDGDFVSDPIVPCEPDFISSYSWRYCQE